MRKLLLGAVAFGALAASPVLAADIPVRAPVYQPPPPPVIAFYNWSGCYAGGNGGGVWLHKDYTLRSAGATLDGVTALAVAPLGVGLGGHDASDGIGGVQAGCNWQVGGWVFGVQGDFDWTNATGRHLDPIVGLTTLDSRTKSLASVTGRVGYAWDRFLGYVKGGGAWERDDYTWFVTAVPAVAVGASENRGGWTVGIGGEYAFTNWLTGFIEYDYYDFGTRTITFASVGGGGFATVDVRETKNVVKAGLNFKFGPVGPVMAGY